MHDGRGNIFSRLKERWTVLIFNAMEFVLIKKAKIEYSWQEMVTEFVAGAREKEEQ